MLFPFSEKSRDLQQRVKKFMDTEVHPAEAEFKAWLKQPGKQWTQPPVMEQLKAKAKAQGLWNLFLPGEHGAGLTNLDYAPLAELMGRSLIGPEAFNCAAPDTGNMEVLVKYASPEQKKRWLTPLLEGTIRSAFAMTEPDVASSDATNMRATAVVQGDEVVLNGRKWWTSGIGHPHCEVLIFMGLTDPNAPRHAQHTMVLVPRNTPGLKVERMLPVFGRLDEPHGHGEVVFDDVRVPKENIIAGPGRGFEIAQGRLGPGRIHHCMRAVGAAEVALELMIRRARSRVAFGKPLYKLNGNPDVIANARIEINMARLLTLHAAYMMDQAGTFAAMSEISQIKVVAPNVALKVIDAAMQMHGGCGVSDDVPLAEMYGLLRTLRLADGPDEVHRSLVAKFELKKHE